MSAMSVQDGIQRFLDDVDPVILSRGQDYYRRGYVESIDHDEGHVTAEVPGSEDEPYLVDIDFDEDREVEAWDCDCPYDWGPVCKHTVAALLALQTEPPEERSQEAAAVKISVRELVERAEKEQLAALILEYCKEDKRFQSRVLSVLEDSGEQELASIKELVRESIRFNSDYGYIDEDGCDTICADLDDALDQTRRRAGRGQYERALDIAEFVLITAMGLLESDNGCLSWTIDAAPETVGLAAKGFAEAGAPREKWIQRILKTAQAPVFDGWEDWRHMLLRQAAVLADDENEDKFYAVLDRLSDRRWEKFQDAPRYEEQDKTTRYHILCTAHGPEDAHKYLEQNLNADKFRIILIREDMAAGDYAHAELLCLERLEEARKEQRHRPDQWEHLLYDIYQGWGQREKLIGQARFLTLLGDRDFYQITKNLLIEDGRWEAEYSGFLAELKGKWSPYAYMDILAEENELALLMEQVRVYRDAVFQHGAVLAPRYGEEIYGLCAAAIRQVAKRIDNRKDYQRLCGLLRSLVRFGGTGEAKELIQELRQAYPRRLPIRADAERPRYCPGRGGVGRHGKTVAGCAGKIRRGILSAALLQQPLEADHQDAETVLLRYRSCGVSDTLFLAGNSGKWRDERCCSGELRGSRDAERLP